MRGQRGGYKWHLMLGVVTGVLLTATFVFLSRLNWIPDTNTAPNSKNEIVTRDVIVTAQSAPIAGASLAVERPASRPAPLSSSSFDPTDRKNIETYIRDRLISVQDRHREGSTFEEEVQMLQKVGAENLDLLIALAGDRSLPTYCLLEAIDRLAGHEHRDLIVEALPQIPEFARLIRDRDWSDSAKDSLITGLKSGDGFLTQEWVESVAAFKDKSTYDALKARLVNNSGRRGTFDAIKDLPKIGITQELIAEAWARAKTEAATLPSADIQGFESTLEQSWETAQFAPIAAEYGDRGALELLIKSLANPMGRGTPRVIGYGPAFGDPWTRKTVRETLLRITPTKGGDAQMFRWFEKHGAQLVYDQRKRRYTL